MRIKTTFLSVLSEMLRALKFNFGLGSRLIPKPPEDSFLFLDYDHIIIEGRVRFLLVID